MGISPTLAGKLTFFAAFIVALSGVLESPRSPRSTTTPAFSSAWGFVAAIIGGLASYPVAAVVPRSPWGLLEAFASFWASAYKEVIVFTLIVSRPAVALADQPPRGGRRMRTDRLVLGPLSPCCCWCRRSCRRITCFAVELHRPVCDGRARLVLLTGVGGPTSFGQAAFVGLGALHHRGAHHRDRPDRDGSPGRGLRPAGCWSGAADRLMAVLIGSLT